MILLQIIQAIIIPITQSKIRIKLRKLQSNSKIYDSSSPPLSKEDIIYFYLYINESLNEFAQTFLSEDYKKLNLTNKKLLNKILNIILPKIKRSVDLTAYKFSVIITKDNFKELLDKMSYQYNKINNFVSQNYTLLLNNSVHEFLNSLNNTSAFMKIINSLGFNNIMEVLSKLEKLINEEAFLLDNNNSSENLISLILDELHNLTNSTLEEYYQIYTKLLDIISKQFDKAQKTLNEMEQRVKEPIFTVLDKISFINDPNFYDKINSLLKGEDNYDFILLIQFHATEGKTNTLIDLLSFAMIIYDFPIECGIIPFKRFPYFQIRLKISLQDILIRVDIKLNLLFKDENKYITDIKDIQVLINVDISLKTNAMGEVGLFIPIGKGEMYQSLALKGLLSYINLKMGLYVNILKNNYIINIALHIYDIHFYFYEKIGIYIKIAKISIKIEFYIFFIIFPHFSLDVYFYRVYSFRNKLLEKSSSAKLNILWFTIKFKPPKIDKLFSIIKEKD